MHARSIVRELTALSFRSAKPVQRVGALYHKNKINPSFSEINVDTVRQFIEETQKSENLTLPFNFTEPESVKFVTQILDFSYMHGMLEGSLFIWKALRKVDNKRIRIYLDKRKDLFERIYFNVNIKSEKVSKFHQTWKDLCIEEMLGVTPTAIHGEPRRPVVICASPRSGSTYIGYLISSYLEREHASAHGKNMIDSGVFVEYDFEKLKKLFPEKAVIQTHWAPSLQLIVLMHAVDIKPIIIFRNIFDVIASKANRLEGSFTDKFFKFYTNRALSSADSLAYISDRYTMKLFEFAHSWQASSNVMGYKIYDFKDMRVDWLESLESMIRYLGYNWNKQRGQEVVEKMEEYSKIHPESFNRMSRQSKEKTIEIPINVREDILRIGKYFDSEAVNRILS